MEPVLEPAGYVPPLFPPPPPPPAPAAAAAAGTAAAGAAAWILNSSLLKSNLFPEWHL